MYLGAAAALLQVYAQYRQSEYQAAVLKAQSQAKEIEAQAREMEAQSGLEAAAAEETQVRRRAAQIIGAQRAISAAAGVDPSTGSPLLMELDSVRQAEIEALNVRRSGEVFAWGRRAGANVARYEGRLARNEASFLRSQQPVQAAIGLARAGAYAYYGYQGGEGQGTYSVLRDWWRAYRTPNPYSSYDWTTRHP